MHGFPSADHTWALKYNTLQLCIPHTDYTWCKTMLPLPTFAYCVLLPACLLPASKALASAWGRPQGETTPYLLESLTSVKNEATGGGEVSVPVVADEGGNAWGWRRDGNPAATRMAPADPRLPSGSPRLFIHPSSPPHTLSCKYPHSDIPPTNPPTQPYPAPPHAAVTHQQCPLPPPRTHCAHPDPPHPTLPHPTPLPPPRPTHTHPTAYSKNPAPPHPTPHNSTPYHRPRYMLRDTMHSRSRSRHRT